MPSGVTHGETPVRERTRSIDALIRLADPNYDRDRRNEVEYEFSNGRKFIVNPDTRGPYGPEADPNS